MDCLLKIDKDVMDLYDNSNKVIIISLPYKLSNIKQAINDFITNEFIHESMLFCCDVIMEFITPSKPFIRNIMKSSKIYNNALSTWSNEEYDKLTSTQSLIIINTENDTFVSLARNSDTLYKNWKLSWCGSHAFKIICSNIFTKVANEYLPTHFKRIEEWGKKIDFSDTRVIGYLCNDGEVAKGDIIDQNRHNGKIFVHFNTDAVHFGRKYEWLQIPNDRICPPPKNRRCW